MTETDVRSGIGVSQGTSHGPVVQVAPLVRAPADEPAPQDRAAALEEVRAAFAQVAEALDERAAHADETAKPILSATAMMARDKGLVKEVAKHLERGIGPATAVEGAVEVYAQKFENLGGYFAERVTDLHDVGSRAVAVLLGEPPAGVPELSEPSVLVAHDLAPAETATLDREKVVGIVTEAGGRTSHTAILAAQMGIPAVVRVEGATEIPPGTPVLLDGEAGTVTLDPDPQFVAAMEERSERRALATSSLHGPGRTADGHHVFLLANIGSVQDATEAAAVDGIEGVGLFRTEFLFLSRTQAPSLEEQTEIYRQVFEQFPGQRVVVRTLDAGADKPLGFADLGPEDNPALGRRGFRLASELPELLDTQLRAVAAAERLTRAQARVMAPMIAAPDEASWFVQQVRGHGISKAGVMVEVPAVALRAEHVLADCDFASIGTNDLTQYTMAADRMQGALSDLLDPWQPAVLDLVAATTSGAAKVACRVGVCGESGGDPLLALVFIGMGVTSLSMAVSKMPLVRAGLAMHRLLDCQRLANLAREAATAEEAHATVLAHVRPEFAAML